MSGRPGACRSSRCPEDMLTSMATCAERTARGSDRKRSARHAALRRRMKCSPKRPPRSSSSVASRWDRAACDEAHALHRDECTAGRHPRSATRISSTTVMRNTQATWASASIQSSRARVTRCRRAARHRRAPGRNDHRRLHAFFKWPVPRQRLIPRASFRPTSLVASISPSSPSRRHLAHSLRGMKSLACTRSTGLGPSSREPRACRVRRVANARARVPGDVDLWADSCSGLDDRLPVDADRHQRCGQLHRVDASRVSLSRLSHASWPTVFRLDGLRRAPPPWRPRPVHPQRMALSWNGDGCYLMNGQELATAVQYDLAIVFRRHRQRHVTARSACTRSATIRRGVSGTDLRNPISRHWRARMARMAKRFCAREEFAAGRSSAPSRRGRPSLLHVKVDPQGDHHERVARTRCARPGRSGARQALIYVAGRPATFRSETSEGRCATNPP